MGNSASSKSPKSEAQPPSSTAPDDLAKVSATSATATSNFQDPVLALANEATDIDGIIRGIWSFIFSYTDGPPPVYHPKPILSMLRDAEELLKAEPTVLDLQTPQCIIGDLHGQGDTLITLLSLTETPPKQNYLFLGNFAGQGFAPHETLFLLLALKVKYPFKVHLLKGNLEEAEAIVAHDFVGGLTRRNLMENAFVWMAMERIFQVMPLAAVVGNKYFCVHGGIGPRLLKAGLPRLRKVERPPVIPLDFALTLECQWACLRLSPPKNKMASPIPEMLNDGSPLFSEADVAQFCQQNGVQVVIRSRQVVNDGVLNLPAQMLTVWSAVSFLDNFRNMAAVLIIDSQPDKASIIRYKQVDMEPESLDDKKPMAGRNAINI
ncbi:hypothetical protein L596_024837 [Steinernema carpocapsae]|uniref:Serine/threonine specific protein phosphatases domain-containing protein n=1 Tax=Steinernema carpocapsae TaxID=34508 RepID=A0A4U5M637_STECR|nr:hypothetical protein L596_024837 [Steinernema carpocapsae]